MSRSLIRSTGFMADSFHHRTPCYRFRDTACDPPTSHSVTRASVLAFFRKITKAACAFLLAPVAVLARIGALLMSIARACEQRGLSVRVTAETPLVERKAIRDLLAYLRVLVNPNDWTAFERVMTVPPRGVGPKTVAQLQEGVIRQGVEATLAASARRHKGLAALLALLAELRVRMDGPAVTLRALIEALDYRAYLSRRGEPDESERRWSHVEELIELANGWESRHGPGSREVLDH